MAYISESDSDGSATDGRWT